MKNKLIVTALILVATMCVSLMSGCWVDSARIEFVEEPAKTYYQGEGELTFSIRDMDSKEVYTYPSNAAIDAGVKVEGFDTTNVGTFTATVTMGDYSIEFTYEVIAGSSLFAGGDGSYANPYEIATPAQFQNMLYKGKDNPNKTYYALVADIDMTDFIIEQVSSAYLVNGLNKQGEYPENCTHHDESGDEHEYGYHYFNGIINGNGYKVTNINQIHNEDMENSKFNEIFGVVGGYFGLSNIEFNFAAEGDYPVTGLVSFAHNFAATNATITFDKVTTTGYVNLEARGNSNVGLFVAQAGRTNPDEGKQGVNPNVQYVIKDCTNKTSIYNATSCTYVAGYVNGGSFKIEFTGNKYEGKLEGGKAQIAAFISMSGSLSAGCVISNNTFVEGSKVTASNATSISGTFAGAKATEMAGYVAAKTLPQVALSYANNTLACGELPEETKYVVLYYSGSFSNGGVMAFSNKVAVAEDGSFVPNVPTALSGETAPAGATEYLTPGVFYKDGTVYVNRDRNINKNKLTLMLVAFDENGKALCSTANIPVIG